VRPYILVSLWAEEDDATTVSHAFALALRARHPVTSFLHGESPSHDALRNAAGASPGAAVVIFAHGGGALSPRRGGAPWIQAALLAEILSGRRVYAFACSTFVPHRDLFLGTFASLAVTACVDVFVGHEAPIMTPSAEQTALAPNVGEALVKLIETFVDGEDDEATLVNTGRTYAAWDLPIELDLPSEDEGAMGWSSAAFLGVFFKSLRVRTKAMDA
jgi:hypothetical protein